MKIHLTIISVGMAHHQRKEDGKYKNWDVVMAKQKKCQFKFHNLVPLCVIATATDIAASNNIFNFAMLFNANVYFKILQYDNFVDILNLKMQHLQLIINIQFIDHILCFYS